MTTATSSPGRIGSRNGVGALDAGSVGVVNRRTAQSGTNVNGSNGASAYADVGNDLMLALKAGDRDALDSLFGLYNPKLYSFIFRIVACSSTAEDIVQETWLTLYEHRSGYQPTFKFSTWLFTIARRKALSELRRRSVRSMVRSLTLQTRDGDQEEMEMPQRMFHDPEATTDGAILGRMVERALATLSAAQREVVILRDIEGFEPEEIAKILQWNVKPGALRKRIFDAREAFRRSMLALGYREQDYIGSR